MIGLLATPLDELFRDVLVAVARRNALPTVMQPEVLGPLVADLAAAYNHPTLAGLHDRPRDRLAARLSFSLPRDVPKVAAAVAEVIAAGGLANNESSLSVLDLGSGLGASYRGLARALDQAGHAGALDVVAVDEDESALIMQEELHKARPAEGRVRIRLSTKRVSLAGYRARHRYDVILLGQVLSELDLGLAPAERLELHANWLISLVREGLKPSGRLVVVEPALRPRSRHLQALRGALVANVKDLVIDAPCLHRGTCPLLARETDWCHEDLPIDLPTWLVPTARAAGLRYQRLTFSKLIVSRGTSATGSTLRDSLDTPYPVVRLVSELMITKGKREALVCGDLAVPRLGRLDRVMAPANAALDLASRGSLLAIAAPLDEKNRIGLGVAVTEPTFKRV